MKKIRIAILFITASLHFFAQSKEAGTDWEAIKQYMINMDTMPVLSYGKEVEAVKAILKQYKDAVEKLDITGTENPFSADSKSFESGGSEGNYAHYLEHPVGPEFKEFKSSKDGDYKVHVRMDGYYAFSAETYTYVIVLTKDNSEIKQKEHQQPC